MKLLTILVLYLGLSFTGRDIEENYRSEATREQLIHEATYLSSDEKAMLWEINLVRSEPSAYVPFIQDEMVNVLRDSVRLSAIVSESIRRRSTTVDGVEIVEVDTTYRNYYADRITAIRELLIELGNTVPLSGLKPYRPLFDIALNHASTQVETKYIDHLGADGSWPQDRIISQAPEMTDGNENIARGVGTPREIVIQLLIDSGVDHRGHRKNILNPEWKYATCYHVKQLDEASLRWWVQEFAY